MRQVFFERRDLSHSNNIIINNYMNNNTDYISEAFITPLDI